MAFPVKMHSNKPVNNFNLLSDEPHIQSSEMPSCFAKIISTVKDGFGIPFFSKQSVRPDSCRETLSAVFSKAYEKFTFPLQLVKEAFNQTISAQEIESYMRVLSVLDNCNKNPILEISEEEKNYLDQFFYEISSNPEYLDKFDHIISNSHSNSIKNHIFLKQVVSVLDDTRHLSFSSKIQALSLINISDIPDLEEEKKLNLIDAYILSRISAINHFITLLKDKNIQNNEILQDRWNFIYQSIQSQFFTELTQSFIRSCSLPTVFIQDRNTNEAYYGKYYTLVKLIQQILMGRLQHVGILMESNNELQLSHIDYEEGHCVEFFRNPLTLPFSFSLQLDITSLIPCSIQQEHYESLCQVFADAFHSYAREKQNNPFARAHQQASVLLGHKKINPETLEQVDFPSAETPLMCSSYVGIAFLKALQRVNKALDTLGYQERIPHPFGEHEDLLRLDILRLVYLWKTLKVIRQSPINEIIPKVFSTFNKSLT